MSVFSRFAWRSLQRSPVRTLVTVIGIMLSMSLFTAVIEGAYSGWHYLVEGEMERNGSFHYALWNMLPEDVQSLMESLDGGAGAETLPKAYQEIEEAATWQTAGWVMLGKEMTYDPYLMLVETSDNFTDLVSVRFLEGRMPQNENEIALPWTSIPAEVQDGLSATGYLGKQVTLHVGKRMSAEGEELDERAYYEPNSGEYIGQGEDRTYTICGTFEPLSYAVLSDHVPGDVAFVHSGGTGPCRVFLHLKNVKAINEIVSARPQGTGSYGHDALLRYMGVLGADLLAVLYLFAGILVFLVAFGSIALIYNAFSISVQERIHQFGILKSVGATGRQIHFTVLSEAAFLCIAGIPLGLLVGCLGIGTVLWALQEQFAAITGNSGLETRIHLVLHPGMLLLAAAVCFAAVLISAWLPARKAIRMNPIQALRPGSQTAVSPKDIRVSPLTQKLFGFSGMMAAKSFRRDRRRRRATVVSLLLSIVLFISASSFCTFLGNSFRIFALGEPLSDVTVLGKVNADQGGREDPESTLQTFCSVEGVTQGLYYTVDHRFNIFTADAVSSEIKEAAEKGYLYSLYLGNPGEVRVMNTGTYFLQDEVFRTFCQEQGLDPEQYFQTDAPAAILYNYASAAFNADDSSPGGGHMMWAKWPLLRAKSLPQEAKSRTVRDIEGYICYDILYQEEDGVAQYLYVPEEKLDWLNQTFEGELTEEMRESVRLLPESEACSIQYLAVGDMVEEVPFAFPSDQPLLICPVSMMPYVLQDGSMDTCVWQYAFQTENSTAGAKLEQTGDVLGMMVTDFSQQTNTQELALNIINVFAYGFITIISLIAAANVFNTISTNVSLRRREFAMLRSVGLSERGIRTMLQYECVVYGVRALLCGLPLSVLLVFIMWQLLSHWIITDFLIPWTSVAVAAGSVFLVVFASMAYASRKVEQGSLAEDLRTENF